MANTLAYNSTELITSISSFIIETSGANLSKNVTPVTLGMA
jgi:hypothetical protein